jgi:hypothetical protein
MLKYNIFNMSWYPAPLWDLRPDITSCRNVAVWNLRSCLLGALCDERTGLQFAVQSLNGPSRPKPETILHCLIWDFPNLEGQVPVFISPRNRVAQLYPRPLGWSDEVEVELLYNWQSVSQPVCLGIEHPCGTCDQILLPVGMLLSRICGLVSMGSPLCREDGSAICSAITQWSK